MPTDKPRISFALSEDLLGRVDAFRFDHHIRNQSQAVIQLMEKGLELLESDAGKKEEPAPLGGLTPAEADFLQSFATLNASNRRILLAIAQVLLQEQQAAADRPDPKP